MVSTTSTAVAVVTVIACGGVAAAAAAAASSPAPVVGDKGSLSAPLLSLTRIASAAVASSSSSFSSAASSSYFDKGGIEIAEAARIVVSVGAGAVLGVSTYVLALASAPLLVSLPREGTGSLRVAAVRCASAFLASAASSSASAMVYF